MGLRYLCAIVGLSVLIPLTNIAVSDFTPQRKRILAKNIIALLDQAIFTVERVSFDMTEADIIDEKKINECEVKNNYTVVNSNPLLIDYLRNVYEDGDMYKSVRTMWLILLIKERSILKKNGIEKMSDAYPALSLVNELVMDLGALNGADNIEARDENGLIAIVKQCKIFFTTLRDIIAQVKPAKPVPLRLPIKGAIRKKLKKIMEKNETEESLITMLWHKALEPDHKGTLSIMALVLSSAKYFY